TYYGQIPDTSNCCYDVEFPAYSCYAKAHICHTGMYGDRYKMSLEFTQWNPYYTANVNHVTVVSPTSSIGHIYRYADNTPITDYNADGRLLAAVDKDAYTHGFVLNYSIPSTIHFTVKDLETPIIVIAPSSSTRARNVSWVHFTPGDKCGSSTGGGYPSDDDCGCTSGSNCGSNPCVEYPEVSAKVQFKCSCDTTSPYNYLDVPFDYTIKHTGADAGDCINRLHIGDKLCLTWDGVNGTDYPCYFPGSKCWTLGRGCNHLVADVECVSHCCCCDSVIVGTVTNELNNDEVVEGVIISLDGEKVAETDEYGHYTIHNAPSGSVEYDFTKPTNPACAPLTVTVDVDKCDVVMEDVSMQCRDQS
ncbi:hypothetical protein KIPB_003482, partial [Kipferlia bialata]